MKRTLAICKIALAALFGVLFGTRSLAVYATFSGQSDIMQIGTKIRFTRDLTGDATGDHPAFIYAYRGETGMITKIGGCKEGYWAKTNTWEAAFGCNRTEFEII